MIKNKKNYFTCGNVIYVKSFNNEYYFEKNGILLDLNCPNCNNRLFNINGKCECGFNADKEDRCVFLISLILSFVITGAIILGGFFAVEGFKDMVVAKTNSVYFENISN